MAAHYLNGLCPVSLFNVISVQVSSFFAPALLSSGKATRLFHDLISARGSAISSLEAASSVGSTTGKTHTKTPIINLMVRGVKY